VASLRITGRPGHERCSYPRAKVAWLGTDEPTGGRYTILQYVAWQIPHSAKQTMGPRKNLRHCGGLPKKFGLARPNFAAFGLDRYGTTPALPVFSGDSYSRVAFGGNMCTPNWYSIFSHYIGRKKPGACLCPVLLIPGAHWHISGTVPQIHTVYPENVEA
jgi:hypothetical protein